jgi:predicted DNA-binding transcriptional regulator AlpA
MNDHKDFNRLLTTKEAARLLGLSHYALERYRWQGIGPPWVHPGGGRAVRYRYRDIMEWIERNSVRPDNERDR